MLPKAFRLHSYQIEGPLGHGGMGEVYRAVDVRLGRMVAIKVLRGRDADNPARLQRFEREARALAGLSHPHICSLYDVGEHEGRSFLVMEALEGETLAERLVRGALPVDELLRHAFEIATAVEHAHRYGIIHSDLKPSNVMLTPSGVKLIDFGVARLSAPDHAADALQVQTVTDEDAIVGTPLYMAPEQLEGHDADPRTDIFAIGTLIHQMATGSPPFARASRAAVIAAILTDKPERVSTARKSASGTTAADDSVPPLLDEVVERCLAKDPADRWQSASDLAQALRWTAESRLPRNRSVTQPLRSVSMGWVAGIVLIALIVGVGIRSAASARSPATRPVAFVVSVPDTDMLVTFGLALSTDGRTVVYVAVRHGLQQLFRRTLDQIEPMPIAGTEGGEFPFFSPNGEWIGFFAGGEIRKVPIAGGPPVTICPVGFRRGASWSADDTIVFASGSSPDLMQVPAAGGTPKALTRLPPGGPRAEWPEITPDGRAVLYTQMIQGAPDTARILVRSLMTGEERVLLAGTNPRISPTGHLLFARGSDLWAAPFDASRLIVGGSPAPLLQGIQVNSGGMALFAVARDGSLVHAAPGQSVVVLVDRTGRSDVLVDIPGIYRGVPQPSPDGRRLAMAFSDRLSSNSAIWIYDRDRRSLSRVTFGTSRDDKPIWADSHSIVFRSDRTGGAPNLFRVPADGSAAPQPLAASRNVQGTASASPPEPILAFVEIGGGGPSLWTLRLDSSEHPTALSQTGTKEFSPSISPDGRWLAYQSNETGRDEVYVRSFPTGDGKWQVSTGGGSTPRWSPNGKELFYLAGDKLMSAAVTSGPVFDAAPPRALFTRPQPWNYDGAPRFAVMPDGEHFLMLQPTGAAFQLRVTLNWCQGLESRATAQ